MDWPLLTIELTSCLIVGGLYLFMTRKARKEERAAALATSNCVLEYPILEGLLGCELGQDTDLFGDTQPQAIANWARLASQEERDKLLREIEEVTHGSHDAFDDASSELFGLKKADPVFDMIRAITLDPDCYRQYD